MFVLVICLFYLVLFFTVKKAEVTTTYPNIPVLPREPSATIRLAKFAHAPNKHNKHIEEFAKHNPEKKARDLAGYIFGVGGFSLLAIGIIVVAVLNIKDEKTRYDICLYF